MKSKVYIPTDEEFIDIVVTSKTSKEVARKLGYPNLNTYTKKLFKQRCEELGVQAIWLQKFHHIYDKSEVFKFDSKASSSTLRKSFLFQEKVLYQCSICGQKPIYQNKELVLRVDHIDGNPNNNKINNLRWLCPNCDSQQSTYCTQNKRNNTSDPTNRQIIESISYEELSLIVENSTNYNEVLRTLNIDSKDKSRTREILRQRIEQLSIPTSHFPSAASAQKQTVLKEVFCENSIISQNCLKRRYAKLPSVSYECQECGISEWNNLSISLHLDHINGINNDNRLINLHWLCPNCHSQTNTFCGRNNTVNVVEDKCKGCNVKISNVSNYGICYSCQKIINQFNKAILDDRQTVNKEKLAETYFEKYNVSKDILLNSSLRYNNKCEICGEAIYLSSKHCKSCAAKEVARKSGRIKFHTKIDIGFIKHLLDTSFVQVGKELGISDNTIRKRLRATGIPTKREELYKWYKNQTGHEHPRNKNKKSQSI